MKGVTFWEKVRLTQCWSLICYMLQAHSNSYLTYHETASAFQHQVIAGFFWPSKNALLMDLGKTCKLQNRSSASQHTLTGDPILSARPGQETGEEETYRLISNDRYLSLSSSTLYKLVCCVSAQEEYKHLSTSKESNGIREV